MNNVKTFTLALSFLSVLSFGMARANEPTTQTTPAAHESNHHNTNFFPKKQANREKTVRPGMVELLEPKALAKISGGQVTLKWNEIAGADSYRVQVATDPNFKWLVKQEDFFKGNSYQVTGLEAGKHYFWRVYAWRTGNDPGWMSSFAKFSSFEAL